MHRPESASAYLVLLKRVEAVAGCSFSELLRFHELERRVLHGLEDEGEHGAQIFNELGERNAVVDVVVEVLEHDLEFVTESALAEEGAGECDFVDVDDSVALGVKEAEELAKGVIDVLSKGGPTCSISSSKHSNCLSRPLSAEKNCVLLK